MPEVYIVLLSMADDDDIRDSFVENSTARFGYYEQIKSINLLT